MSVLRSLILLLVLANLAVLAVFSWFVDQPAARPAYDGPGITLLRETEPAAPGARGAAPVRQTQPAAVPESTRPGDNGPADTESVDNAPAGSDAVGSAAADEMTSPPAASVVFTGQPGTAQCISIGPFALPADADTAMEALTAAGFAPTQSTRETEIWDGYWVFIEQLENQAAAREIAADLAENGIGDTQVIASSERGTLLSIGVFSDISRAGTQAERVNRVGYEATIADSMRSTQTHWLDVVLTSEETIALELLQEPGRISRLQQLACDQEGD